MVKNVMMRTHEMEMDAIIIARLSQGSFVQVGMLQMLMFVINSRWFICNQYRVLMKLQSILQSI